MISNLCLPVDRRRAWDEENKQTTVAEGIKVCLDLSKSVQALLVDIQNEMRFISFLLSQSAINSLFDYRSKPMNK